MQFQLFACSNEPEFKSEEFEESEESAHEVRWCQNCQPFTWDIRSPLRKAGWYCSPNGAVPNLTEANGNDELIEQTKPY